MGVSVFLRPFIVFVPLGRVSKRGWDMCRVTMGAILPRCRAFAFFRVVVSVAVGWAYGCS